MKREFRKGTEPTTLASLETLKPPNLGSGGAETGGAKHIRPYDTPASDFSVPNKGIEQRKPFNQLKEKHLCFRDVYVKRGECRKAELMAKSRAIPAISKRLTFVEIERTMTLIRRLATHLEAEDCFMIFALKAPGYKKWVKEWRSVKEREGKSFEDMIESFLRIERSIAPVRNPHNEALYRCRQHGSLEKYHFEFSKQLALADKEVFLPACTTMLYIAGLKKDLRDSIMHVDFESYQEVYTYCKTNRALLLSAI